MTRLELQRLRKWADAKIATGQEPPWAWFQLMKLREALDALIGEMEAESIALEMQASLPIAADAERGPRLVVSNTASDVANELSVDELGLLMSIKSARSR